LRIATELHDDIGANLSQIAILTEVARRDGGKATLAEVPVIARETVELMSDIVWAVNPHHDGFDALLQRMRRFASDTLAAADIQLEFSAPEAGTGFHMPLEIRRPVYLVFKEAINNIAKHSGATAARVHFGVGGSALVMEISDNGRGFDRSQPSEGDGLSNMIRRMRESGGDITWETARGSGTKVRAKIPLG
jgi:signal transduction histidine kinase